MRLELDDELLILDEDLGEDAGGEYVLLFELWDWVDDREFELLLDPKSDPKPRLEEEDPLPYVEGVPVWFLFDVDGEEYDLFPVLVLGFEGVPVPVLEYVLLRFDGGVATLPRLPLDGVLNELELIPFLPEPELPLAPRDLL